MSPTLLRFCLIGVCILIIVSTVSCVKGNDNLHTGCLQESFNADEQLLSNGWDWDRGKFKCPSNFGSFPDPTDCYYYYVCYGRWGNRKQCPRLQLFDKNKRKCVSFLIAVCDDSTKTTTKRSFTDGTTRKDDTFKCPNLIGTFAHPEDCSMYYSCTFFIPSLKTCPQSQLFDSVQKQCRSANDVQCDTRIRPTEATTVVQTTRTSNRDTTAVATTTKGTTTIATTTTAATTMKDTTTVAITTTAVTTERTTPEKATTEEIITTPEQTTTEEATTKPPVTAPDTDCDEDDLDCIIDDLGEKPEWFECPKDMGSYPHPTSKKLFIFCLNWKPKVKKCGQDLVFSVDVMTCVKP